LFVRLDLIGLERRVNEQLGLLRHHRQREKREGRSRDDFFPVPSPFRIHHPKLPMVNVGGGTDDCDAASIVREFISDPRDATMTFARRLLTIYTLESLIATC